MSEHLLVRETDPARGLLPVRGREELLSALRASGGEVPARTRRSRRSAVVATLGAGVLAASSGLAYAVITGQSAGTALKINCSAGIDRAEFDSTGGFTSVIDTTSGDPVADCASEYERLTGSVPALVAYDAGNPFVWVLPDEWKVPAEWKRLPSEFRSDSPRLALKQRLEDPAGVFASGCLDDAQAEAAVREELAALGLSDWTVERPVSERADGRALCSGAGVAEDGRRSVYLYIRPAG